MHLVHDNFVLVTIQLQVLRSVARSVDPVLLAAAQHRRGVHILLLHKHQAHLRVLKHMPHKSKATQKHYQSKNKTCAPYNHASKENTVPWVWMSHIRYMTVTVYGVTCLLIWKSQGDRHKPDTQLRIEKGNLLLLKTVRTVFGTTHAAHELEAYWVLYAVYLSSITAGVVTQFLLQLLKTAYMIAIKSIDITNDPL